jgi:hypothetical protein
MKQTIGQMRLQFSGTKNEKVLQDKSVSAEEKEKIKIILSAKKFFLDYFDHKDSGIYSKTTFLDSKAVSWLVIASKPDDIQAYEHEFPFFGSFPYLGFFSKDDAEDFVVKLKAEKELNLLPSANVPAVPKSTRAMINERVAAYSAATLIGHAEVHKKLHKEFYYRHHNNLHARFMADRDKYKSKLDIVEELGLMDAYLAIACEVLEVA